MKRILGLTLGLYFAAGTALAADSQPTLPQGPADRPCDSPASATEAIEPEKHAIVATVKGVDRQQGLLELSTKDGRFLITTSIAATQDLHEGDRVLVCFEGNAIDREERLTGASFSSSLRT